MSRNHYLVNRDYELGDPFFRDFFAIPFGEEKHDNHVMKADVKDEGDHYLVEIDVPSIKKEDIKLSLKDGFLTVSAKQESSNDKKDSEGHYIRRERFSGSYSRSFDVGENVSEKDIQAKLENGTLKLTIAKVKEVETPTEKLISIQ